MAMLATERHLLLNLEDIGRKEKRFLLDVLVSPSEWFGTSVEMEVDKFKEAKACSAAFKSLIPYRFMSAPKHGGEPGPSWSAGQVVSDASHGPPPQRSRTQRRCESRNKKKSDLRDTIQRRRDQPSGAGSGTKR